MFYLQALSFVISYWFTYQIGTTQKDTTQWGYSYTHTSVVTSAATPTFTPAGGTYRGPQTVTIASATSGATIYYTTNGSNPSTSSTVYSSPITVSSSLTVKAIAVKSALTNSAIGSAAYTIGAPSGLAKFEPTDGKTLIAIGQTKSEMDAYHTLTDVPDPAGYMIYTSITDAGGMTGPVKVSQIGFLALHESPLESPSNVKVEAFGSAARITWDKVEDARIYNVYKDNQLIGMTDTDDFTDSHSSGRPSIYSISGYEPHRGEGAMSVPASS
ncbi:chitobiase/beta-hexosaminidase C-terminal domain-containing protein [Paenibacillus sp. YIM B09110]|uniref:chitobiase/beta-hexosaminidase C-terminal domain-containing protein n=1 Tax=Paenibacillus sp. YIM B09110 TaxID=3126102 RepID=UPI00301E1137